MSLEAAALAESKNESSVGVVAAFGAALIVLIILAAISITSLNRFAREGQATVHTVQMTHALDELAAALLEARSEQRAYVMTGSTVFLSNHGATVGKVAERARALEELALDSAARRTAARNALARDRLTQLARILEEWEEDMERRPLEMIRGDSGTRLQQVEAVVEAMRGDEMSAFDQRMEAFQRQRAVNIAIVVLGNAMALLFLTFSFRRLMQESAQRARAEAAANLQARAVEDLYENAPCGYHSLDASGQFIRMNRTELQWLGYEAEEVIGKLSLPDLLTPEGKEIFRRGYPVFKKTGMLDDMEFDLVRKDGTLLPVSVSATAVRDANGAYIMSRSTVFDISRRRQAQQRMHEAQAFLESVLENIPALVVIKDARDLRFLRLNQAGEELLGLRREQVIGKTSAELFDHEKVTFAVAADQAALVSSATVDVPEEPIRTPAGVERVVHTRKVAIRDKHGEPTFILAIAQ
ncbi:MAG: PAS domain-containing protein, partial [Burkholderiales bacterium]|nr:PAS domain-containing protein [Burkholderiales bacterium]